MYKKRLVFRKIIRGFSLLIGLSVLTFAMLQFSPIDPITAYVGEDAALTMEQRAALEEHWGLNRPPAVQYFSWLGNLLKGDFGYSKVYRRRVLDIIAEKALASAALMGISWVTSGLFGFILGVTAAIRRGSPLDRFIRWISYVQASVPTFWLGLLLLIVFAVWLKWFPIGISVPIGVPRDSISLLDRLHHLVLPALTLTVLGVANVTLHTREKMIEVLGSEYVLFAKARGRTMWQIIRDHGLRNVALPAITLHFAYFGELFGGSVLAEQVFSYPGLGSTLTEAGLKSDLPLLMGIVLISAIFVFCGNMIADILNGWINPRLQEAQ